MNASLTDEELVAAFQSGQLAAFDVLVERWSTKIRGAIYRVLGSEDDARDLSQEAFLKAYRALGGFRGQARFSSWLYQIALNLCRDRLRRRRGRHQVSLEEVVEQTGFPAQDDRPSPLELAEQSDLARRVSLAVAELPGDQREVIVLKEYEDLTFAEIAEVLDVPISTVKTRLYRGLERLRDRLEQAGIHSAAAPGPRDADRPS